MSAISSIASALGISDLDEPVTMGMEEFDTTTSETVPDTLRAFQYFPETINDGKSTEYSKRSVPGGSHPIVSFVNGGERVISFVAVFTQLRYLATGDTDLVTAALTGALSLGGGDTKHSMDAGIAPAIAWLRSFTYPEYLDTGVAKPPPAATVYLPNSGLIGSGDFADSFTGVMTDCNVIYEAFHRNGQPKIVAVSLSFIEIVQTSPAWRFQGRDDATFAAMKELYTIDMQGLS